MLIEQPTQMGRQSLAYYVASYSASDCVPLSNKTSPLIGTFISSDRHLHLL